MSAPPFRILVVEDSVADQQVIRRALEPEGGCRDLEFVRDGETCLARLAQAPVQLVILDYSLPGMSGLEVLRRLRARAPGPAVIMVTGMGSEEIAVQAMKMGAADYLVKSTKLAETLPLALRRLVDRLEIERDLRQTTATLRRLEEVDRLKSEFIANVSHELRTPLVSILGYADYLLQGRMGPLPPEHRRALEVSRRNAERLQRIIESLLLHSGLAARQRPLDPRAFHLERTVSLVVDAFRPESERRELRLTADLPCSPVTVMADEGMIEQVLTNLIGNALKFTGKAGEVRVVCRAGEDGQAHLAVSDTGCGIPRAVLGRVFERFWQAESGLTRRYGGLGLGLAIVKEILDAHGCPIRVESEEGKGSTFAFTLPLAPGTALPVDRVTEACPEAAPAPARTGPGPASASPPRGQRILIVDDEIDVLSFLSLLLGTAGYRVHTADTGARGLELAEREPFDLALLDVAMGDLDGLTMIRELRRRPRTRRLPVWMVSARAEETVRDEAAKQGAAGFVTKPFVPDDLLSALARFFAASACAQ